MLQLQVLVHHGFTSVILFDLQSLQRNMLFGLRLKNSHTFDDLGLFVFLLQFALWVNSSFDSTQPSSFLLTTSSLEDQTEM